MEDDTGDTTIEWWEEEEWRWADDLYWEGVAAHFRSRYNELADRWDIPSLDCE